LDRKITVVKFLANKRQRGMTLIELIVAISIASILLGIGLYSWNKLTKRRTYENDTLTLYSELTKAKLQAFTEKRNYTIHINADSINVDNGIDNVTISLKNPISSSKSFFKYSKDGICEQAGYIRISSSDSSTQYDCVDITINKISMGKFNGTKCVSN
jgi:prepilin-type N-terminal cleavage/methylation domain-containing protein